jgi:hypothetical protein
MRLRTLGGAITAALLSACSTDSTGLSPAAESLLNSDVATVSADAAAQDVELMRGPGVGPFGLGLLARVGSWDCDREGRPNFDVTRTCIYKDAAGNTQSGFDPVTTASVIVHAEIAGEIERGRWSATVDRVRDLTVTGLAGAETQMTWNGTGQGTVTRVRVAEDGTTRGYEMNSTTTITNVVIPVPRSATSWPKSGTISKHIVVKRANGTTIERTVTIVFNGTQTVTVTVNGETFDFDLAQRGRPHRRG